MRYENVMEPYSVSLQDLHSVCFFLMLVRSQRNCRIHSFTHTKKGEKQQQRYPTQYLNDSSCYHHQESQIKKFLYKTNKIKKYYSTECFNDRSSCHHLEHLLESLSEILSGIFGRRELNSFLVFSTEIRKDE